MIRYLSLAELLHLYQRVMEQSGGAVGLRDLGLLESCTAQPRMTFAGEELYPSLPEKAAALGFSLICNHPFVDGNKRIGHAAMELFLILNGSEIQASLEEQEQTILSVAEGSMSRAALNDWLKTHLIPIHRAD